MPETVTVPHYVAEQDGVEVRKAADDDAGTVTVLPYGTRLNLLEMDGEWALITRRNLQRVASLPESRRALGWVPCRILADREPSPLSVPMRVDADAGLDVWFEPSLRSVCEGILSDGDPVTVVSYAGPWARVEGKVPGWVLRSFLVRTDVSPTGGTSHED